MHPRDMSTEVLISLLCYLTRIPHQSLTTRHSKAFLTWASGMEMFLFIDHRRQNTLLLNFIISIKERKVKNLSTYSVAENFSFRGINVPGEVC